MKFTPYSCICLDNSVVLIDACSELQNHNFVCMYAFHTFHTFHTFHETGEIIEASEGFSLQSYIMFDNKLNKRSFRQFPLSGIPYEQLEQQKKEVIRKLLYLFVFYASKSSKNTFQELHQNNYSDLIEDIWEVSGRKLVKGKGDCKQLQILYYTKGTKKTLTFKNFLDMLPSIATFMQPQMNRQECLRKLIQSSLAVYSSKVLSEIDGKVINSRFQIDEQTREFIRKLYPEFAKLYKVYFPRQLTHKGKSQQFKSLSFFSFFEMLQEFEVYPKVISARDIFYIFNEACEASPSSLIKDDDDTMGTALQEMGEIFTLSKMIESILTISRRGYTQLKQVDNEEDYEDRHKEMLRTLLEYMETIKTTTRKKTKFMHQRLCFILQDEHASEEALKTLRIRDKETVSNMDFFTLIKKMSF